MHGAQCGAQAFDTAVLLLNIGCYVTFAPTCMLLDSGVKWLKCSLENRTLSPFLFSTWKWLLNSPSTPVVHLSCPHLRFWKSLPLFTRFGMNIILWILESVTTDWQTCFVRWEWHYRHLFSAMKYTLSRINLWFKEFAFKLEVIGNNRRQ